MTFELFVVICNLYVLMIRSAGYVAVLTTIPPRFEVLHYVISSWFEQEIPPEAVIIALPSSYSRFKSESETLSTYNSLMLYLRIYFLAQLRENRLVVLKIDRDYGPITKYVGVSYISNCLGGKITKYKLFTYCSAEEASILQNIMGKVDYFIVGDDDVFYSSTLSTSYSNMLLSLCEIGFDKENIELNEPIVFPVCSAVEKVVLSQFIYERRAEYSRFVLTEGTPIELRISVPHVQGVDTVMLSKALMLSQETTKGPLSYHYLGMISLYYNRVCPRSFLQDDYVISFIFSMSELSVISIWSEFVQQVGHIEGVSKSLSQMHMRDDVHESEWLTKQCISEFGARLFDVVYMCNRNITLCELFIERLIL